VGRSAQGDHIEQLRRMGDHVRRSYLLLEGNPRFASGFTAFGLADARAGSAEEAVTEEADVIELCCALLVDGQAAPCFAPRISPCVAACVAACCATRAHCVHHCVHTAYTLIRTPLRLRSGCAPSRCSARSRRTRRGCSRS